MSGEKRLILAVLTQAFCDYHDARKGVIRAKRRKDAESEKRWMFEVELLDRWFSGNDARITFPLCCEMLDLDPERTAEKLKTVHAWRLYRRSMAEGRPQPVAIVAALEGEVRRRERLKRERLTASIANVAYGGLT